MGQRWRWISLAVAVALLAPLPVGWWTGLHVRLSPWLLLQSLLARLPLGPLAWLGGLVVVAVVLWPRWFCRQVCPTGALCDLVNRTPRPRLPVRLPRINQALAVAALATAAVGMPVLAWLDPTALFFNAGSFVTEGWTVGALASAVGLGIVVWVNWARPHVWCTRICPLGGLQDLATVFRQHCRWPRRTAPAQNQSVADFGRRYFLAGAGGLAIGFMARRAGATPAAPVLRPPSAGAEERFRAVCCRCGTCARACPTRIIRPTTELTDLGGLLAPRLDYTRGYCLPECVACGAVCPTGALPSFRVADKPQLKIGIAVVDEDACLLAQGQECSRCEAACPYTAISIRGGLFEPRPVVRSEYCVGCGACVVACPPQAIAVRRPELHAGKPA